MNLKSILGATALAVGLLGAAQTGHAAIIVTEGASGTGDNVVFNSCNTAIMGPRSTLTGCLNNQPNTVINLTSDELLRWRPVARAASRRSTAPTASCASTRSFPPPSRRSS
jgi:hypothetical protein